MQKFIIFIKHINDVVISDMQELSYIMNNASFHSKTNIEPIIDNEIYYVGEVVKLIEIDYFDMYIKIINEQGSVLVGQIIGNLDLEFSTIPADIHIMSYKKDKESYYIYAKY